MSEPTMQKMLDRFRLKITKSEQDARKSFRGEPFIQPGTADHDGTEVNGVKVPYCIIPAHDPDYVKALCQNMKYTVSDPFIPGIDDKPKKAAVTVEVTEPKK